MPSSGGAAGDSGLGVGVGGNATASKQYSTMMSNNADGEEHGGVSY